MGWKLSHSHLAQAADPRLALQATNTEVQLVAQFQAEALGQLGLHRDAGQITLWQVIPPLAIDQHVARRKFRSPGQAEVALDGALPLAVLADDALHRLAVDQGQAPGNDRVERCRMRRQLSQTRGEGFALLRQDVEREVVG